MNKKGTLTFFCGKMGAGKTTKSKTVSLEKNAVLLCEDDWLEAHYPNQINSFDDFIKFSTLIKPFVKSHVQQILNTGTNVVMNFPANTKKRREEQPHRAQFDNEDTFKHVTQYFETPSTSEDLNIVKG